MSKQIPTPTPIPMPKKPVSPMQAVIIKTLNGLIDELKYDDDFIEVKITDHSEETVHNLSIEAIEILHAALVEYVKILEG